MPTVKMNITIDSELKKELKKIAIEKETSSSEIITKLLIKYLRKEKESC